MFNFISMIVLLFKSNLKLTFLKIICILEFDSNFVLNNDKNSRFYIKIV